MVVEGEGVDQNVPGGKLSRFLKMGVGGLFLGRSLIIK